MNELERKKRKDDFGATLSRRPTDHESKVFSESVNEVYQESIEPYKDQILSAAAAAIDTFFMFVPKFIFVNAGRKLIAKMHEKDPSVAQKFIGDMDVPWDAMTDEDWDEIGIRVPENVINFHKAIVKGMKESTLILEDSEID